MATIPAPRPSVIPQLVGESEELEERMSLLQGDEEPSLADITGLRRDYRAWHLRARRVLSADAAKKFDEHRDGNLLKIGISRYLGDPRKESPIRGEDHTFPFGRWQHPFDIVHSRLEQQRNLLLEAEPEKSPAESVATELAEVLRRLPEFLRVLQRRRPEWPIGEAITDERELQVVVEALLRTLFDDVRPEDYVPSRGGANSRVDFILPEAGVVVETKMTRASMSAQKLGEELFIDAGRYPTHPDCNAILAYIYDPHQRLDNPRGIERDLTMRTQSGLSLLCVIS